MEKSTSLRLVLKFLLLVLVFGLTGNAAAQSDSAGQIVSAYGEVWISVPGSSSWRKAPTGTLLYNGYGVKTGRMSGANMRMEDESLIRLSQHSEFVVEELEVSSFWRRATSLLSRATRSIKSSYRLISGKLWGRNNNRYLNSQVTTTTATIGIRGTEYSIEANKDSSSVTILEGVVLAANEFGEATIRSGESTTIQLGKAPVKSTTVKTRGSVQWTVLVPDLLNVDSLLPGSFKNPSQVMNASQAYAEGNLAEAFDLIEKALNDNPGNVPLQVFSQWLLIKSGQADEAYSQLKQLSSETPSILIDELLAFTAFLNGDLDRAQQTLGILESQDLLTDTGWLIQGYLAQASHDLPAAREAYLRSLQVNSNNLPARVQLATVYFGSENNARASRLVNQALDMNPSYVPALNLKGFLALAENDSTEAIRVWQGIEQNQVATAETHFGLSLGQMRKGQTEEAMQNIATAVLMDPQRSMYLSYWGKMLHQIGRHDKALTVLDSAIRLDPEDPTPRLYKAIILRDLNRPGEAISSIQQAIDKNDNRGVYRSRSLLDKDEAIQNVDLSRLFTQLGLNDWAHKKAIDSINRDYANASAHIFNAGAYAQMEDRSYALFNEALLARLYQPANINAFSSYNDYTSLYERPETELHLTVGAGNHGQVDAGLYAAGGDPDANFAWGAAAVGESSDGWRDTNGEELRNLSAIGKWQLSRSTDLMLTLSNNEIETKEETSRRYEIDKEYDEFAEMDISTARLEAGLLHRLEHDHDLMFFVALQQFDSEVSNNFIDQVIVVPSAELTQERLVSGDFDRPYNQIQFQGLKHWNNHQLFYGVLVYDGKSKIKLVNDYGLFDPDHTLIDSLPGFDSSSSNDLDIRFTSLYVQDSWSITDNIQIDLALHAEQMDNANPATGGEWELDNTNLRLGLAWNVVEGHTLRVASYAYILPFVTARLDPSDIAGITIFRNAAEGSEISETDLVWDYEWDTGLITTTLFNVEMTETSAIPDINGNQIESSADTEKQGASVIANLLLGSRTGLAVGFGIFDQEEEADSDFDRSETQAALSLTHVFSNSLTVSAKQIFRQINFEDGSSREDEDISVTNLYAGYEFDDKAQAVEFHIINLADEEFNWITDDFASTGIAPERMYKAAYRISF